MRAAPSGGVYLAVYRDDVESRGVFNLKVINAVSKSTVCGGVCLKSFGVCRRSLKSIYINVSIARVSEARVRSPTKNRNKIKGTKDRLQGRALSQGERFFRSNGKTINYIPQAHCVSKPPLL